MKGRKDAEKSFIVFHHDPAITQFRALVEKNERMDFPALHGCNTGQETENETPSSEHALTLISHLARKTQVDGEKSPYLAFKVNQTITNVCS